jgi:hypothetical protein
VESSSAVILYMAGWDPVQSRYVVQRVHPIFCHSQGTKCVVVRRCAELDLCFMWSGVGSAGIYEPQVDLLCHSYCWLPVPNFPGLVECLEIKHGAGKANGTHRYT